MFEFKVLTGAIFFIIIVALVIYALKSSRKKEEKTPDLYELSESSKHANSNFENFEVNTKEIDNDLSLENENKSKEIGKKEESDKIDFDKEEDKLIASIAKEVEMDEEEIDLLRDLKGQEFDIHELKRELGEILQKLKDINLHQKS